MTIEIKGTPPSSLAGSLDLALLNASWLTPSDGAAVALARRIALALDVALDMGEIKDVPQLSQRYLAVLQQLHLTTETRTQGNKEDETDGSEHLGNYLRILQTPTSKSKSKPAQRRSSSS